MKKLLFFLIVTCSMVHTASAQTFTDNNIVYNVTSASTPFTVEVGDNASSTTLVGAITIPETVTNSGVTYTVTSISSNAFENCTALTSITIPNSVTSINSFAFSNCTALTSVTIPNSVTSIESRLFNNCIALTSVTIPNSVTSIKSYAFTSCAFTSITIPNSVTYMEEGAFFLCSNLTSLTIPDSVTSIGRFAFSSCSNITSITIPNSITSIADGTFNECSALTSVTLESSNLTSIGNFAFYNLPNLTEFITYTTSPPALGPNVFTYGTNIHTDSTIIGNIDLTLLTATCPSPNPYSTTTTWQDFKSFSCTTLPIITEFTPLDNALAISTNSNLQLTFDKNIVKGTGNIVIYNAADNTVKETIDVTTANVTINNTEVTINPTSDLEFNKSYYVQIAATAFKDVSNTNFNGISDTSTWNFTTAQAPGTATHLNFDGVNDIVDMGTSINTVLDGINTFTVEANVRTTTTAGLGIIIGNHDYPAINSGMQFLLRRDGSNYVFWIDHGSGYTSVSAVGEVTTNTWQHVAGVWDGTNMKIYVDGVLKNTKAEAGASFRTLTTDKLTIGGNANNQSFNGDIDEVRVWSKVRTAAEILANKDDEISNTETGLLAYYQFNQGTAGANNSGINKLTDNSVNSYTGTLTNFALSGSTSNWMYDISRDNKITIWNGSSNTDWSTAANWSKGVPTATDDVVIPNIANKPIIGSSTNAVANDITIDASSSITVTGGGSLTLDGDLTNNGTLTVSSGMSASSSASLMVSGSSTGNITYQRYVGANWHLVSSPVEGQQIGSFITASGLTNGTVNADHTGLGFYNNATPVWEYFLNSALPTSNFIPGNGYAALKTAAGTVDFTGTLKTNDLTGYAITEGDDGWNLIGNPYPSYIDVNAFLTSNLASFDASFANVYVWNGTAYAPISGATYMAPGQGFFVKSVAGGATIDITEAMQSHQSATFYRNNSNPEINLSITDQANNTRNTKINFLDGKTTGLDPMFDVGMFTATNNSYAVYSHLISDSQGIYFEIQALPNQDYETVIVPIGINAVAGKEITFKVEDLNLPAGIKVFLEDRENNTFIRLDEDNSQHTVNVTNPLSGIGRFYLRTSSNSLSVDDLNLENINIYTMDNSILRIAGIEATGKKTLSMFDILGQRIVQESFNKNGVKDITLPNVSSGVYIIHLQTERGRLSKKIILN